MGTQFVELSSQHYRHVKRDSRGKWFQRSTQIITISRGRYNEQDINISPTGATSEHRAEQVSGEAVCEFRLSIEYRADVL